MENYWIVDNDSGILSSNGIFYETVLKKPDKTRSAIVKYCDGRYYGSTDVNREDKLWVQVKKKDIMIKSDIMDVVRLLYFLCFVVNFVLSHNK